MLKIRELNFGFSDAENYKRRENKQLFNDIFLHDSSLDKLCDSNIFFLIGEKGTGKTAYAVYLSNNEYKNNVADIRYIRETDYRQFISLKREQHLELSDYEKIWRVILSLLIAQQISSKEKSILARFTKFNNLKNGS